MAKCLGCGTELAANARFCSLCGRDAAGAASSAAPTAMPGHYGNPTAPPPAGSASGGDKKGLYLGGGLIALAIAAFFIARAAGLFSGAKAEPQAATGVLSAPQTQVAAAPILTAPSVAPPSAAPVLQAPQAPPARTNPMPADVAAYLRWLKQFEAGRQQLSSKGEAQMMLLLQDFTKEYMTGQSLGLLDGDSGDGKMAQQQKGLDISPINNVIQDWNKATGLFQQKQPPAPCTTLASNYKNALASAVAQMTQVTSAFLGATQSIKNSGGQKTGDAQQTLEQLMQEKNGRTGSQSVDGSLTGANDALDAVRNQYTDIPPDIDAQHFSIKADGGSLKLPGLPF